MKCLKRRAQTPLQVTAKCPETLPESPTIHCWSPTANSKVNGWCSTTLEYIFCEWLSNQFLGPWIGRGGSTEWPKRFPILTPRDLIFCGLGPKRKSAGEKTLTLETEQEVGDIFAAGGRETSWRTGIQDNKHKLPCNVTFLLGKQVVPMEIYVNGAESWSKTRFGFCSIMEYTSKKESWRLLLLSAYLQGPQYKGGDHEMTCFISDFVSNTIRTSILTLLLVQAYA